MFKKRTPEDLLVLHVMNHIKFLNRYNPFKYLTFSVDLNDKKFIYILLSGTLYLDLTGMSIEDPNNFVKHCFKFDGKLRNFIDLENYEFLKINEAAFTEVFTKALNSKKVQYGLN